MRKGSRLLGSVASDGFAGHVGGKVTILAHFIEGGHGDCRVKDSPYKAYRVAMVNAPTREREDGKKVYEDSTVFMPTTEVVMMM